ncbi:DUF309 domain-containing protein [Sagittula stellata]|uniref:DUF309 domain-containing protein n=1 Tax=Sagittula stellata (strain ATCC 700073 / DSM 11524 / E-37) TaxID=388399 RepID=A3K0X8_SAGS3|nr:DUF309 domain-containing protein [Sagittula stellata]EBA09443.1 hypothetical protein SSE37_24414 [Sagittula stellata E-37]
MSFVPYVPGRTPRPPDGAYDALKEVSVPLQACGAWHAGLRFYRDGAFWEAHEVWEAVWMAAPEKSAEKLMVQGVIQLANARLKRRMGRDAAADRLEEIAADLMREAWARGGEAVMGVMPSDSSICEL